MVDSPFFLRHTPPGKVHLFPWRAIGYSLAKSIVTFTSVKLLFHVLSVLEIRKCATENASVYCSVTQ